MKIIYAPSFTRASRKLPIEIKAKAEEAIKNFEIDPSNPKLRTHKLQGRFCDYWSFSVDYDYRIMFYYGNGGEAFLITIGNHDIYS
jgi:mRNA-degrading endonuclease YafQ of YafQ-DinJ toxin-antitoxin module